MDRHGAQFRATDSQQNTASVLFTWQVTTSPPSPPPDSQCTGSGNTKIVGRNGDDTSDRN